MVPPQNDHPAYVECPSCGAIELLYTPQDYQEGIHNVEYTEIWNEDANRWELIPQIIASFGG
jgi:hypothetical protein